MFAAANATQLVCGRGVTGLQAPFDVAAMRPVLERSLERQVMTQFPRDASRVHGKRRKVVLVAVDMKDVNVRL